MSARVIPPKLKISISIPAQASIKNAEQYLPVRNNYTVGLKRAMDNAAPLIYDYVIFDCPPFLGAITINALSADQLLIIPTQAEYFSAYALRNMMSMIRRVRQESNSAHLRLSNSIFRC